MPKMNLNNYRISILFILAIRLFLNAVVPLMDKTEARYAEIARLMYETQNWITPQIDYGVAFWAKPPLSIWLNAMSIHLFGINEFSVRFPSFLLSILVWWLASKVLNQRFEKVILALVIFTIPQFILHAGVVSTDMSLLFSITLIMVSFWKQMHQEKKTIWGYLIFLGIGIGLLAKGPIVLILTLPPIFFWCLYYNQWSTLFKKVPFLIGTILALLIALPWYILAEQNTPGFIDYFILGEHFKRFIDSGWDGDKYGFVKKQPLGIIWMFFILLNLPWFIFLSLFLKRNYRMKSIIPKLKKNAYLFYLTAWLLWTPFFFTFSKSLIHTYMLPSVIPLGLIVVYFWKRFKNPSLNLRVALILPILALVASLFSLSFGFFEVYAKTDKYLIKQIENSKTLFYLGEKTYSSQFYSNGRIKSLSMSNFNALNAQTESFNLIIEKKLLKKNPKVTIANFKVINQNNKKLVVTYP